MIVIFLLIPISIVIGGLFLAAFIWAVRTGQYEDTCTPSMRVLMDDLRDCPQSPSRTGQQITQIKSEKELEQKTSPSRTGHETKDQI